MLGSELWLAILAGIGVGWILRSLLASRELGGIKQAHSSAVGKIAEGAQAQVEEARKGFEANLDELRKTYAERSETWDREREAVGIMNQQLYAQIEVLQGKLFSQPQTAEIHVDPGQTFPGDTKSLKEKVNAVLGESQNYSEQIGRLVAGGFSVQQAQKYLAGELDELPELDEKLDRVVSEALAFSTGVR